MCVCVCVQMLTNPSPPRSDLIVRMNIYITKLALGGGHWVVWPWSWHTFSLTLFLSGEMFYTNVQQHILAMIVFHKWWIICVNSATFPKILRLFSCNIRAGTQRSSCPSVAMRRSEPSSWCVIALVLMSGCPGRILLCTSIPTSPAIVRAFWKELSYLYVAYS